MRASSILVGLAALLSPCIAASTSGRDYFIIKAVPKPGQIVKQSLKNLVMRPGVGPQYLQYPVLTPNKNGDAQFFFLAPSHGKYSNLAYQLSSSSPISYFNMTGVELNVASWQTVAVSQTNLTNVFPEKGNFYLDGSSGIAWTSSPSLGPDYNSFGGWLACQWWFNQPQLFWINTEDGLSNIVLPDSCVNIELHPVYLNGTIG